MVKQATKKRATCFATLLENLLYSDVARFTTHVQTCFAATKGCATSLFKSFCSNTAKQVARFCCPIYRAFTRLFCGFSVNR